MPLPPRWASGAGSIALVIRNYQISIIYYVFHNYLLNY
jgi:hypothetical protein